LFVANGAGMAHSVPMTNPAYQDWAADAQSRLLDAAIRLSPEAGWSGRLVQRIAKAVDLSEADVELLLPRGASDLSALLSRRHDRTALEALGRIDSAHLKVRERIHVAVEARIEAAMADEAAVRASGAYLALPVHLPLALRLGWESADVLWRWAGDQATDENHYSKRAILATILATTLAARMAVGHEHARKHLSSRIDQVMAFETWKATRAPKPGEWGKQAAEALARFRYGARRHDAAGDDPPPPASS
jgi:ubiquinone biosynthesis protein COQ9